MLNKRLQGGAHFVMQHHLLISAISLSLLAILQFAFPMQAQERDSSHLSPLVEVLGETDDPQFQMDILKGLQQGLQGRRQVAMPEGWSDVEEKLTKSPNPEVRELARSLSLTFGSERAKIELRNTVQDTDAPLDARRNALQSLLDYRDEALPPILFQLLESRGLRTQALKALAAFHHPRTPRKILQVYPQLAAGEKRDALNTLASRASYAEELLNMVEKGKVPRQDLTADLVRQLRSLGRDDLNEALAELWGVARQRTDDAQEEIRKYKSMIEDTDAEPPNPSQGRLMYTRACQQCHTLFGLGGKVGPELTGSNRADLDYILENMVDPNAVIPNDYRTTTLDTKDGRVIMGVVQQQDPRSITMLTPNDTVTVPRDEIASMRQSELSMMPEGLLQAMTGRQVRDLVAYLAQPEQVPLSAAEDTLHYFFNGEDLTNWEGNPDLWSVENGEIVGRSETGLPRNEFLISQMVLGDFRLICEVRLQPNSENSGIQFRSKELPEGEVKGYQADMGQGWWGKLYEEHGRAILWDQSIEPHVRKDDWNTYEILAVGHHIQTAINGHRSVDLKDPEGALEGVTAFQLHSGGPLEVRFRKLQLELNPDPTLKTLQ